MLEEVLELGPCKSSVSNNGHITGDSTGDCPKWWQN